MELSRRSFFKGIAAAATVAALPLGALAADPRVTAWQLLEESDKLFKETGKSVEYFNKTNELFAHLVKHFYPTDRSDKTISEVRDVLRGQGMFAGDPKCYWKSCSNTAFVVMIIRDGLRHRKLPMVQASMWKNLVRPFSRIIMSA